MNKVTEAEAKEKWCPMARVSYHSPAVEGLFPAEQGYIGNREHSDGPIQSSLCIGSACMMWRWGQEPDDDFEVEGKGFCGLAGGL